MLCREVRNYFATCMSFFFASDGTQLQSERTWRQPFADWHPITIVDGGVRQHVFNPSSLMHDFKHQLNLLISHDNFTHASISTIATIVYLKTSNDDGSSTSQFVTKKTKVASTKQLSIPMLKLAATKIGAKLAGFSESDI